MCKILALVFERRSNANGTKRPATLHGMAFPVTNDVAKAMRGESSPQRGARPISVRQPSTKQKQESLDTFALFPVAARKAGTSGPPSVLIVDDNHINRQVSRALVSTTPPLLTSQASRHFRAKEINTS